MKCDPGPLQLDTLLAEIVKLERVKAIGLSEGLFEGVSEKIVAGWRARAMKMYPSDFAAAPERVRITLLVALCWARKAEMIEGLVELLIQLVHKISVRAEKKVENEIAGEFRKAHGKNGILVKLAEAALELPEEIVRKALYPVVGGGAARGRGRRAGPGARPGRGGHLGAISLWIEAMMRWPSASKPGRSPTASW
ncbi:hypothetical protein AB0K16_49835 [Nonomuraea jabiensis]|uniref:hypothetical protein n=1 Tax=Nonomuraea jabiensis TaxID=882448 RepID=UPI003436B6E3